MIAQNSEVYNCQPCCVRSSLYYMSSKNDTIWPHPCDKKWHWTPDLLSTLQGGSGNETNMYWSWLPDYENNWGEPERAPHRRLCCEFSIYSMYRTSCHKSLPGCILFLRHALFPNWVHFLLVRWYHVAETVWPRRCELWTVYLNKALQWWRL